MILQLTFPVSDKSQDREFYKVDDNVWSAVKLYIANGNIENTELEPMLAKSHEKHRCTPTPPLPEDFKSLDESQRGTVAGHYVMDNWEKIEPDDVLYFKLI